ncbi:hypothetical protein JG688_00000478 [Phytophthora aleatoria]|uniref:Uncharacterized protein n=1 Tax=Phytophthora aleatoria TaxID=2496075 RepID=A0A8J5IYW2_9STRA|nr:hypothetical protein JG688_00000478 [Phytophthora aleatoria]
MPAKTYSSRGDNEACSLLTVVRFVVRERLQLHGIELSHVWRGIDDFYVAAREPKEAEHPSYRMWMVNNVAALAMDRGDVKALEWLAKSYSPDTPVRVEDW